MLWLVVACNQPGLFVVKPVYVEYEHDSSLSITKGPQSKPQRLGLH